MHDDPVLDQPGPDTVESADGIRRHHGEAELPITPARTPSPRLPLVIAAATLATAIVQVAVLVAAGRLASRVERAAADSVCRR